MAERQGFDAEILGFVLGDMEVDNGGGTDLWMVDPTASACLYVHPMVFWAQHVTRGNDDWAEVLALHHPDVLDLLANGNLRMNLVIDSHGGIDDVPRSLVRGMRNLQKRGGTARAFGLSHVHSAAARIWKAADERYVTPKTRSIMHTERYRDSGEVVPELVKPGRQRIETFFKVHGTRGHARDRIIRLAREAPDAEIDLTSTDLIESGVAQGVFASTDDVLQFLADDVGVDRAFVSELFQIRSKRSV